MRLTDTHARFWMRAKGPRWVQAALIGKPRPPVEPPSIHACINAHAGIRPPKSTETVNTVALLKLARKTGYATGGGTLRSYLWYLRHSQHSSPRRVMLAEKWLKRLGAAEAVAA